MSQETIIRKPLLVQSGRFKRVIAEAIEENLELILISLLERHVERVIVNGILKYCILVFREMVFENQHFY